MLHEVLDGRHLTKVEFQHELPKLQDRLLDAQFVLRKDPKRDGAALRKLRSLFPGREIVGVPGREILLGGGNVHCITQQVPAGRVRRRAAPRAR